MIEYIYIYIYFTLIHINSHYCAITSGVQQASQCHTKTRTFFQLLGSARPSESLKLGTSKHKIK